jgi:hypothetical protein
MNEKLFANWKTAMRNSATGPLTIACEVVENENKWDPKHKDTGGLSYTAALERALGDGHGLRFFRSRANAVNALGGMRNAVMFHHAAAVWLTGKLRAEKLEQAITILATTFNQRHQCPMMTSTVVRVTRDLCGYRPRTRIVSEPEEIARLRQRIADLEIENAKLSELLSMEIPNEKPRAKTKETE